MAIVINGSGTVTGISVGGLPDDIVDAGTLADNAVGLAQMAGGTDGNIITYDTSGNPAAVATGSDGQVLTSAGADAVPTMAAVAAGTNTPAFRAKMSGQTLSYNTLTKLTFSSEDWDTDSAYDPTTNYRFTVPAGAAGKYYISAVTYFSCDDGNKIYNHQTHIYKNGSDYQKSSINAGYTNSNRWHAISLNVSTVVELAESDYIEIYAKHQGSAGDATIATGTYSLFAGYKLIE